VLQTIENVTQGAVAACSPAPFTAGHASVRGEAEHLGAPMVVGSAVREMLAITLAFVGKEADFSEVVKVCEAWAGVEVRG
jgi:hypothetical protein